MRDRSPKRNLVDGKMISPQPGLDPTLALHSPGPSEAELVRANISKERLVVLAGRVNPRRGRRHYDRRANGKPTDVDDGGDGDA